MTVILPEDSGTEESRYFYPLFAVLFVKFYFLEYSVSDMPRDIWLLRLASAGVILILTVTFSLLWRKIRGCAALVRFSYDAPGADRSAPPPLLLRHVHIHEHWTFHAGWGDSGFCRSADTTGRFPVLCRHTAFIFIYLSRNFTSSPFLKKRQASNLFDRDALPVCWQYGTGSIPIRKKFRVY